MHDLPGQGKAAARHLALPQLLPDLPHPLHQEVVKDEQKWWVW